MSRLNHVTRLAAMCLAVVGVAACGGGGGSAGGSASGAKSDTLRIALTGNVSSPDPAIFYENEGLSITNGLYEGLLKYASNTDRPEIVPSLATEWEKSEDGLTYTFTLQEGVKFHDGTALDSEAMKKSFERLTASEGGPSYMLASVGSYETPDPQTFVVKLKEPVEPFLDFMASPYGPKAYSPKVLDAHKKDASLKYLKNHDAGTGPYQIATWKPGDYRLKRFEDYWGEKANFADAHFTVEPSFTTQGLNLQQGQLDVMVTGVLPRDIPRVEDSGLQIDHFKAALQSVLSVNTNVPPFDRPEMRKAFQAAVDREQIVKTVYGNGNGTVAKTIAPGVTLPEGTETWNIEYDPEVLKTEVAKLPPADRTIRIGFSSQDVRSQQVTDLLQTSLSAAGLDVTTRGVPQSVFFGWPSDPKGRPNIMLAHNIADAPHPQAWYSLFHANGGGLNWLGTSDCEEADRLQLEGYSMRDSDAAQEKYVQADQAYVDCGGWVPLADLTSYYAARPNIEGIEHPFGFHTALDIAALRNK